MYTIFYCILLYFKLNIWYLYENVWKSMKISKNIFFCKVRPCLGRNVDLSCRWVPSYNKLNNSYFLKGLKSIYEYLWVFTSIYEYYMIFQSQLPLSTYTNTYHSHRIIGDRYFYEYWWKHDIHIKIYLFLRYLPYVWVRWNEKIFNLNILMNYMYFHDSIWSKKSVKYNPDEYCGNKKIWFYLFFMIFNDFHHCYQQ